MQVIGTLWKWALRNLDRPELVRPSTFAWSVTIALMVGIMLERGGVDPRPSSVPPTIVSVPVLEDESVARARKLLGEVESAIDIHRALSQWEVGTQTWCDPGFAAVLDCGDDRCRRLTTMAHCEQGPVACNDDTGGCIRCDEAVGPAALACREVWRPDPAVQACRSMMQRESTYAVTVADVAEARAQWCSLMRFQGPSAPVDGDDVRWREWCGGDDR